MTTEPDEPSHSRFPRRFPKRTPRFVTVPASELTPIRATPPTREEFDALMQEIEERAQRYERDRERLREFWAQDGTEPA